MVPKIHAKGKSFTAVTRYLLSDIGADTAHRVAWTDVRNVACRNPRTAARVLAATAMDQDRLKRESGVPNTGRKSKDHVLHFTLSWHADEARSLTRGEMLRATNTVLHVMGAQEHQALIVAHRDKPQPHVHVIVNRVHPRDGRILSSSFEKLKASRWAQKYEEERGKIYCDQRVINNAARKRGQFTRGKKDEVRHVHELAKAAVNDNNRREALIAEHRRRAFELKEAERRQSRRHREAWQLLEAKHRQLVHLIEAKTKQIIAKNKAIIAARFRPKWEAQHHEHQAQLREFEQREAGAIGRMKNALRSIDLKALLKRERPEEGKANTLREAFALLGDAGARLQALKRQQAADERNLLAQQRQLERQAIKQRKAERQRYLDENRRRFEAERVTLVLTSSMEQAKLRAQWKEKGRKMREEWKQILRRERVPGQLSQEFATASNGKEVNRSGDQRSQERNMRQPDDASSRNLKKASQETDKSIEQRRTLEWNNSHLLAHREQQQGDGHER